MTTSKTDLFNTWCKLAALNADVQDGSATFNQVRAELEELQQQLGELVKGMDE